MEYSQDSFYLITKQFIVSIGICAYSIFSYYSLVVICTQGNLVNSLSEYLMSVSSDYIHLPHLFSSAE